MEINDLLKSLDLRENEAEVYLASLELGETNIVPIKEKTGYPRTTVWHILEDLAHRNLIEIIETGKGRHYAAHPPRKILTLIKQEQEELKEKAEVLEKTLPELNRLYQSSPFQPRIRFYRGEEIKQIYEEMLKMPIDEILYVGETGKIAQILHYDFFSDWVKRKVKQGIWTKSLRVKVNDDPFFDPKKDLRKAKYLPEGFKCPVHYYIYGDNVAMLTSAQENFGVLTTSRENATAMRSWFGELWKVSK